MEGWCKEMEREAEENDLSEESKNISIYFLIMSPKIRNLLG